MQGTRKKIFISASFVLIFLLGFVLGFLRVNKNMEQTIENEEQEEQTVDETSEENGEYVNETYGFSFEYPAGWMVEEIESGEGVRVSSAAKANADEALHDNASALTADFLVVPKYAFSPIQTKVGDIEYSPNEDALVDTLESPARCLPVEKRIGAERNIPLFLYSVSLMATPTYEVFAIVTDDNYLLIHNVTSYDASAQAGLDEIYDSLRLGEEVRAVGGC